MYNAKDYIFNHKFRYAKTWNKTYKTWLRHAKNHLSLIIISSVWNFWYTFIFVEALIENTFRTSKYSGTYVKQRWCPRDFLNLIMFYHTVRVSGINVFLWCFLYQKVSLFSIYLGDTFSCKIPLKMHYWIIESVIPY